MPKDSIQRLMLLMEPSHNNGDLGAETKSERISDPLALPVNEQSQISSSDAAKVHSSPAQAGIVQLIDYVRVLADLSDKPVWSLVVV
jgi:hypothetical protein